MLWRRLSLAFAIAALTATVGACRIDFQTTPQDSATPRDSTITGRDGSADVGPMDAGDASSDVSPTDTSTADTSTSDTSTSDTDACTATPEVCNGVDDDCDMMTDEGFTVATSIAMCPSVAGASPFTVAGFTFAQEHAATSASIDRGQVEGPEVELFLRTASGFDPQMTIGHLLSLSASPFSVAAVYPNGGGGLPTPNVTRTAIAVKFELTGGVPNLPGDDFVVFESVNPEPFAVRVESRGSGSRFRYEFPDAQDTANGAWATAFDLSDFGIRPNGTVHRILVMNLFNADAASGEDRVAQASGEGQVVQPSDADYATAFPIRTSASGPLVPTSSLDPDIVYIVSLHPIVDERCCVP